MNRTDEELALSGEDPYAMIRYSASLLSNQNGQKPDIHKALSIMENANNLYPDNFDVKEQYARMLLILGHIDTKIGAFEDAFKLLGKCVREIDFLKANNWDSAGLRNLEVDACMEYGEMAERFDNNELALDMFSRTDRNKYPYAVVCSYIIQTENPDYFAADIAEEVEFLKNAVNGENWRNAYELSAALYILGFEYANGFKNYVKVDVDYAYNCICRCLEVDPEMPQAQEEKKKYSKNLFGKLIYRGR